MNAATATTSTSTTSTSSTTLKAMRNTVTKRNRRHDGSLLPTTTLQVPDLPADVRMHKNKKPKKLPWKQINWQAYLQSGNTAIVFWLCVTIAVLVLSMFQVSWIRLAFPRPRRLSHLWGFANPSSSSSNNNNIPLLLFNLGPRQPTIFYQNLEELSRLSSRERDFGGLTFSERLHFNDAIVIHQDDYNLAEHMREKLLEEDSEDSEDDSYQPAASNEDIYEACVSPGWVHYSFPTCNAQHENDMDLMADQEYQISYLNSGTYRDAFLFQRKNSQKDSERYVLKRMLLRRSVAAKDIYKIHKEAIVLERLSHSPQVLDIYSYCGTSVVVEAMVSELQDSMVPGDGFASQKKLDKLDNVYPRNNFTASEKLQITLSMATSLADLHGFSYGPITHADVHPEQWLIAADGSIKLNDFNNAHEVQWNARKQMECERDARYGNTCRSPEEFAGTAQNESVDIFALGSIIYSLLTGLWPFYDEEYHDVSHSEIRRHVIAGQRAYVDPRYRSRSFIEGKLVDLMERSWDQDRKRRPTIFEVVAFLKDVKKEAASRGELHPSSLFSIPIPE